MARLGLDRIHWMSCAVVPRSATSAGTATVSAMLSMTSTSVLRQSAIRISQRRECGCMSSASVLVRIGSGVRNPR
ncbi:hypothetical protein BKM31_17285 [[Actinomadura] parvosata subsp. kistnae]|uniref:Uncharacterized protein n=1 Tax=[Actinomadura] parvosata subsp. kistnae TaxID=1909395 RepID=A0A1U9ZYF9_9ACTN|nr:hypothetical protein BKM31_17285 [Nonomuraea sp. ATCC 55076]